MKFSLTPLPHCERNARKIAAPQKGVAPILETRKVELSLTVDQQKIETMPLNGRNYLDLANFANGVHASAGPAISR